MAKIYDLVKASEIVYETNVENTFPSDWEVVELEQLGLKKDNFKNGFFAKAFRLSNNEIIVSFRGTELKDNHDIVTNLQLGLKKETKQSIQAKQSILAISKYAKNNDINEVYLAGHSLGGHLAQKACEYIVQNNENNISFKGLAINAPGSNSKEKIDCFYHIDNDNDIVNVFGGTKLGEIRIKLETNGIVSHGIKKVLNYLDENPFLGELELSELSDFSIEDIQLIRDDMDSFIIEKVLDYIKDEKKAQTYMEKAKENLDLRSLEVNSFLDYIKMTASSFYKNYKQNKKKQDSQKQEERIQYYKKKIGCLKC
jgi:hypothetical protein